MSSKDTLRSLRDAVKTRSFLFAEKYLGLHITPVHYYSPIPNVGELPPDVFTKSSECVGLDLRVADQVRYLDSDCTKYLGEYTPPVNTGLSQVDAFILYSMIRARKPRTLVEVGSGESTKISLAALARNKREGAASRFVAVEPFPMKFVRDIADENFELIERKVQDVDIQLLSSADILFIDSSHVATIGSDVNCEILDIVPRLKVGALVHWHDIMIPVNYSRTWIESGNKFWNESYMVHAFMLFNRSFKVCWASRYMQLHYPDKLSATFSYFSPTDSNQQLSSFWIERVS